MQAGGAMGLSNCPAPHAAAFLAQNHFLRSPSELRLFV
jgi:hypothetical protein